MPPQPLARMHTHTHTHTRLSLTRFIRLSGGPCRCLTSLSRRQELECFHAWLFRGGAGGWVSEVFVSTDARRALPSWCNPQHGGRVSQRYRFESRRGEWALFSSYRQLYLSSFSLTHTHTHTRTHNTHTHAHTTGTCTHKQVKFTIFILHKHTNSNFGSVKQTHDCKH